MDDAARPTVHRPWAARPDLRALTAASRKACRLAASAWVACALAASCLASTAPDEVRSALRERVAQWRAADGGANTHRRPPVAAHKLLASFYERRAFAPAWTQAQPLRVLAELVDAAPDHGLEPGDYHAEAVHAALAGPVPDAWAAADRDLLMTDALVRLAYHLHFGKANPRELYPGWNFSRQLSGREPVAVLEALISGPDLRAGVQAFAPRMAMYTALMDALRDHRAMAARGGWPRLGAGPALREGMTGARVQHLRERLAASGDALARPAPPAGPEDFDGTLAEAVHRFQSRHGLAPDGVVGRETQQALDIGVAQRIEQLRVNLERLRWVAQDLHGDYLLVDVAGFSAQLYEDDRLAWTSRVTVGRPYRRTPSLRTSVTAIVLNPTWTVPPTILREDLLPKLARDPAHLAALQLRVTDRAGRPVDPATVDWSRYRGAARGFPYQLVQPPGPLNPLGELKFVLSNSQAIYLHDTPDKTQFGRASRALSSGCIRVERAHQLAVRLLDDPEQWSPEALREAIARGRTTTVALPRELPVMLLYFTARAEEGQVLFHPDLYGRDPQVLAALRAPVRLAPVDPPPQR